MYLNVKVQFIYYKEIGIKVDRTSLEHIWSETMDLAERHCLTIYDASYLEVSITL